MVELGRIELPCGKALRSDGSKLIHAWYLVALKA